MREVVLVFVGGGLGSVVRFLLGRWINAMHTQSFPYGTLVVNVAACLVLGVVVGMADHRQMISPASRMFWAVGFCGGFSTFSTFSMETLVLFNNGLTVQLILYVLLSLLLCFAATFGGLYAGENV